MQALWFPFEPILLRKYGQKSHVREKKIVTPNSFSPSPKPGVIKDSGAEFSFLKKSQLKKLFIVACFVFLLLCVFLSESNEVNMTEMRSNIKRKWTIRGNFSHSPGLSNRQNILDTEFRYGCSNRARKMELSWKHMVTFSTESFCRMRHKYPQQSLPWT